MTANQMVSIFFDNTKRPISVTTGGKKTNGSRNRRNKRVRIQTSSETLLTEFRYRIIRLGTSSKYYTGLYLFIFFFFYQFLSSFLNFAFPYKLCIYVDSKKIRNNNNNTWYRYNCTGYCTIYEYFSSPLDFERVRIQMS